MFVSISGAFFHGVGIAFSGLRLFVRYCVVWNGSVARQCYLDTGSVRSEHHAHRFPCDAV